MPDLSLTLACGDYDRTRSLHEGSVRAEGVSLTCLRLPVEEIFFRMARFAEFDIAELSLSSYLLTLDDEARGPFVAIPVYPSRAFRHNGIYIRDDGPIGKPQDLVGATVGVPEYQVTAAVWIRGILQDHHDVPVASVRYRTGGLHDAGRVEKLALDLPDGFDVAPIGSSQTLSEMLADGQIDALYSPRTPASFAGGLRGVTRLFPEFPTVEAEYFSRTGIFPIMHVIVIRRPVYEANRWIARSLQKAFEQSRVQAMQGIDETAAFRYMLPWLQSAVEQTRAVMGLDYWTYGLEGNVPALETLARYSYEQGLARRAYRATEIFAPETLDGVRV